MDPDLQSAKTFTLIAIILQAVLLVFALISISVLTITSSQGVSIVTYPNGTTQRIVSSTTVYINPLTMLFILIAVSIIPLIMIFLDYFLVYKPISEERAEESKTPSLVLGIIQLFTGGIIVGILLILAYVKINDAINRKKYESLNQQDNIKNI